MARREGLNSRSIETKHKIMEAALAILKTSGIDGLTMRQVAATAGKSLNNVQHHFKNKTTLLNYLAEFYFNQCNDNVAQFTPSNLHQDPKRHLYEFIVFILEQSEGMSDVCLIFRELWAVATRDKEIERKLNQFYAMSVERACTYWSGYNRSNAEKAASVILPYIEGYSIQYKALPVNRETIAELLADVIHVILTQPVGPDTKLE